jgi:mannose-6-phosphate isomerase-like protein (cupin superfamily)
MSYKDKKHAKSAWVSAAMPAVEKPWGREIVWRAFPSINGKILYLEKGKQNSFKYNEAKNECLFVLKGEVRITYGDELSLKDPVNHPIQTKILTMGESLSVQSGCPYRLKAITDVEIIEIGDSNRGETIRLEDDYGRANKGFNYE